MMQAGEGGKQTGRSDTRRQALSTLIHEYSEHSFTHGNASASQHSALAVYNNLAFRFLHVVCAALHRYDSACSLTSTASTTGTGADAAIALSSPNEAATGRSDQRPLRSGRVDHTTANTTRAAPAMPTYICS